VKVEPLAFRLNLLKKDIVNPVDEQAQRSMEADRILARQVLELAAEKSGWGKKSNLGIAVGRFSSHCAQVAEVDMDKDRMIVKKSHSCNTLRHRR
jgi:isoquinoline 1-oxidoreductase beta subunit